MTSRPPRAAVALAALAAVLVLVRVVLSTVRTLADGTVGGLVTGATVLLLVAALVLVAATTSFAVGEGPGPRRFYGTALVGFLVVMAGYLALGWLLALTVPWTAYAVLLGVAVLGSAARAVDGRSRPRTG